MNRGWMVMAVTLLASGCASTPLPKDTSESAQVADALKEIHESSVVAVNAQQELVLTRDAKAQREAAMRRRLLSDHVTYDFYGDAETIVRDIATKYGYDFKTYGKRPPEGVPINVYTKDRPVLDVLKNIGVSADQALNIVVKAGVIEIHYHDLAATAKQG